MKDSLRLFLDRVSETTTKLGLEPEDLNESDHRINIHFARAFPVWLTIEIDPTEDIALFYVVGRAFGIDGDKSDYHDLLASIFAICFRLSDTSSAYVIKESHFIPGLEGEIYAFNILFHKQPPLTFVNLNEPDYERVEKLLVSSVIAAKTISAVWEKSGKGNDESAWQPAETISWISPVLKQLRIRSNSPNLNAYTRRYPSWDYLRIINKDIFVARLEIPIIRFFQAQHYLQNEILLDGVNSQIIESPKIKNAVPNQTLKLGYKILYALGHQLSDALVVPTESHLYILADKDIIGIGDECGLENYREEKSLILRRYQSESQILFPSTKFKWKGKVDDNEFEKMVLELLNREPGIWRARKIGQGNEPDFGRDILAEWYRPYMPTEHNPLQLQRVVVQCKAYNRPVDKSRVSDIVDLLHFHNATGYLLVALSGITKPLIDFLEKVGERENYWTDWWTRIELEARLRANRDIAVRYSHLVEMIESESS